MIYGIGTDIVEIERISNACESKHFVERIYTAAEIEMLGERMESYAGNFAAKDAIAKAIGTGFRSFGMSDIEILRDELGKPYVNLYGNAKRILEDAGMTSIHVSISHHKTMAVALAIIEK